VDECKPLDAGGIGFYGYTRPGSVILAVQVANFVPDERQGLTLVHFSAQLEPCLTQESTLHTPNIP